jgi:hypothetical protein
MLVAAERDLRERAEFYECRSLVAPGALPRRVSHGCSLVLGFHRKQEANGERWQGQLATRVGMTFVTRPHLPENRPATGGFCAEPGNPSVV